MKKLIVSAAALLFAVTVFAVTAVPGNTSGTALEKVAMLKAKKAKNLKKIGVIASPVAATTPATKTAAPGNTKLTPQEMLEATLKAKKAKRLKKVAAVASPAAATTPIKK